MLRTLIIITTLALAACSQNLNKLEKAAPQQVGEQSLLHPPWEVLQKAGPGAENDFDLETLDGTPPAPISPPKGDTAAIKFIALLPIKGASPQGGKDLTNAMRNVLSDAGWPVLEGANPEALTLQGTVKLGPAIGATQSIQIIWIVLSPKSKNLGTAEQNNQIPSHSLDGPWGQTATDIAQAASQGIFKIIEQYR